MARGVAATGRDWAAVFTRGAVGSARVQLEQLTKRYGDLVAVDALSLDIAPGEFLTLLGPSGSGKTTTLMMLAGFEYPTTGRIAIDGSDVTFRPPHKRDIGVVFQSYALFPHLTVFDNIAFPLSVRGYGKEEIRTRVEAALELVQLGGQGRRMPRQLSGGMQQRVALARAIVFGPRLLLMDEPLGALDPKLRESMQLEIKRIQQSLGTTVLYVTHDQDEALTMSDRIAVMNHGRIVQIGTAAELYERPADEFVAGFLGECNFLPGTVQAFDAASRQAHVGLANGTIVAAPVANGVVPAGAVTLGVRPERCLIREGPGPDAPLIGRVQQVAYLGDAVKLYVAVEGGAETVVVKQLNREGLRVPQRGEVVHIGWASADARLFPRAVAAERSRPLAATPATGERVDHGV